MEGARNQRGVRTVLPSARRPSRCRGKLMRRYHRNQRIITQREEIAAICSITVMLLCHRRQPTAAVCETYHDSFFLLPYTRDTCQQYAADPFRRA
jgi:hypothetical protein